MLRKLEILLQSEIDPAFAKRAEFIFQAVEEKKPKKILEVGCGRGFYLQALSLFDFPKEIQGIDISEEYVKKAKKNCSDKRVSITQGSVYSLPYDKESYDLIICSEVLEHLDNQEKGLSEIRRVLKKGGNILITVPNERFPFLWDPLNWILMRLFNTHVNKNIWWLAGIWAGHERLYTRSNLTNIMRKEGFEVVKIKQFVQHAWPLSHFALYGIGKNLVERCGVSQFNRFQFKNRANASILATLFRFPTRFDNNKLSQRAVSLCLSAQKK